MGGLGVVLLAGVHPGEAGALGQQVLGGLLHVGHPDAEVLDALAVLAEEGGVGGIALERFDDLDGDAGEGAVVDLQLGRASVDVLELVDGLQLELRAEHLRVAGGGHVGVVDGPAEVVGDGFIEDRHGASPRGEFAADDSDRGGARRGYSTVSRKAIISRASSSG